MIRSSFKSLILGALLAALGPGAGGGRTYRDTTYFDEIQQRKRAWFEQVEVKSGSTARPMTTTASRWLPVWYETYPNSSGPMMDDVFPQNE